MAQVNRRLSFAAYFAILAASALTLAGWSAVFGQTTPRPPGEVPYLNFPPGSFPPLVAPAPPPTGGPVAEPSGPTVLDALKQRDRELQSIRADQKKSRETEAKLKREIEAIGEDRRKLNRQLIEVAARVRAVEEQIAGIEQRLVPLDAKEQQLRKSLHDRRDVTTKVLAALQRIGRNPPPAILVRPEDALQSLRSALLLGAVLPDMRREVETVVADLSELGKVRQTIATERAELDRNLTALAEDRTRLTLLMDGRQKQLAAVEKTLVNERQHAVQLARQAEDLRELIAGLEQGLDAKERAARFATRPVDNATEGRPDFAALNDPGRLAPAIKFASAKRMLPLPVSGARIRNYGAPDGLGGSEKGLSIATRPGAHVTAPCDGWVVYSGPFRNYGQLLILNAGDGYHVLLAGMERISVELGQFVVTGEPVAVMGGRAQSAKAIAIGSGQPVLYVEFRKDGTPIDPGPWWAASDNEKVRG
jgi:septal ring factor EnvC (AmiA/AmiB activator)